MKTVKHIKEMDQDLLCVCIFIYFLKIIKKTQNLQKGDKMELYTADRRAIHKMLV